MTSFLFGRYGAIHVTEINGYTSLAPGLPIIELPFEQRLLAGLITDGDAFYSSNVTTLASLRPALVDDADAIFAAVIAAPGALLPVPVNDADVVYGADISVSGIVLTLLPAHIIDPETVYPAILLAAGPSQTLRPGTLFSDDAFLVPRISFLVQTLRPSLAVDPETVYPAYSIDTVKPPKQTQLHAPRTNDLDVIFAARLSSVPLLVVDTEIIFAPISQAVYELRTPLLAADDAFFSPFVAMQVQAKLIVDTEAIYRPLFSLFLLPQRVDDVDTIPAADIGWKVFAQVTNDADAMFGVRLSAYNDVLPDVWVDEEHIDTYPFFVQQIEGGIAVPKPPGILTGTVSTERRLTGSISQPRRLTGSFANKTRRVLTGSVRRK